jgi:hypothetical protein
MRENAAGLIAVFPGDFTYPVVPDTIRTEYDIASFHSFTNRVQGSAGKTCCNLRLTWILFQKDRNELLVELLQAVWDFTGQVYVNIEIHADKTTFEAFFGIDTLAAQHETIIFTHSPKLHIRLFDDAGSEL